LLAVVEETVNVTVQLELALSVAPERERLPPAKVAVPPLQVVPAPEPFRFAGSAPAATASPVNCSAVLGLVIVKVSVELPTVVIAVGEKAAAIVGAWALTTSAVGVVAAVPVNDPGPLADGAPVV
jgi:hypothetical protein